MKPSFKKIEKTFQLLSGSLLTCRKSDSSKAKETVFWRKTKKIILNGKFQNEALSWKGHDVALLQLFDEEEGEWPPTKLLCLPQPKDKIPGNPIHLS